jgi:hypothetical protein
MKDQPEMSTTALLSGRKRIVILRTKYKASDSLRERAELFKRYENMTKTLIDNCPHNLIVVDYSQSYDYAENCRTCSQHHCIVCGLAETGYDATVDMRRYVWCSGTYKVLKAEPLARFETGPCYAVDSHGYSKGRWNIGEDLDQDLDDLLEWVKQYGLRHTSAAEHKAHDDKRKADEKEQQYQHFKKEHHARLKEELTKEVL